MRKIYTFIICMIFAVLLIVPPTAVEASENNFSVGGVIYRMLDEDSQNGYTAAVSDNRQYNQTSVRIPDSVEYSGKTYRVTEIDHQAFFNCVGLEELQLSEGLEFIGKDAFRNTAVSGTLSIPSTVKYIMQNAFTNCKSITALDLPADGKLLNISVEAFKGTSISGTITLPASVKSIGGNAFENVSGITGLNIPEDSQLENIYASAFNGTNVTGEVNFPASLKEISMTAFQNCRGLKKIRFAQGSVLKTIGTYAFSNTGLTGRLDLPPKLQEIGAFAFLSCKNISQTLIIPQSVTKVNDGAFRFCSGLTAVVFEGQTAPSIGSNGVFTGVGAEYYYPGSDAEYQLKLPQNSISYDAGTAKMLSFFIDGTAGIIDEQMKTVTVQLPWDADVSALAPSIGYLGSAIRPSSEETVDFRSPKQYNISAVGKSVFYTVTVLKDQPPTILVKKLILEKEALLLPVGRSETITAEVLPENASDKRVKWVSSDERIAGVDAGGRVTAESPGETTITALSCDGSGIQAICRISVIRPEVTGISIAPKSASVQKGKTLQFTAAVDTVGGVSNQNAWTLTGGTDSGVSADGLLKIGKNETAKTLRVTAISSYDQTKRATAVITITSPQVPPKPAPSPSSIKVSRITIMNNKKLLEPKKNLHLKAGVWPSNATNKAIDWRSSNPKVAKAGAGGKIIGVSEGKVTITAAARDGSAVYAAVNLTVGKKVLNIRTANTSIYLKRKGSITVPVIADSKNSKTAKLVWKSSNPSIAKVSGMGKITGVKNGKCKVTATALNGKKLTIKVSVSNKAKKLKKLNIKNIPAKMKKGRNVNLKVKLTPQSATGIGIKFKSSKPSIVKVDKAGKLTALKRGKSIITVKAGNKTIRSKVTVK